jgi:hypothetical protein
VTLDEAIAYCDKHLPRLPLTDHSEGKNLWSARVGWGLGSCNLWFPLKLEPGWAYYEDDTAPTWGKATWDELSQVVAHIKKLMVIRRLRGEQRGVT